MRKCTTVYLLQKKSQETFKTRYDKKTVLSFALPFSSTSTTVNGNVRVRVSLFGRYFSGFIVLTVFDLVLLDEVASGIVDVLVRLSRGRNCGTG